MFRETRAMEIIAKCPRCHTQWALHSSAVDRRITCAQCGRLFKVPPLQEIPKAERIIRDAKSTLYVDEDGRTYG